MLGSIAQIRSIMRSFGATRFYAKKLAPNDNSKNQIYLGGDFSALNIIPHGDISIDGDGIAGSKRDRAKADVRFYWIDTTGKHRAPNAQLILYPKYPEVRMSGFLKGCTNAPAAIMRVRDEGRMLVLGITNNGEVLGYAAAPSDAVSREIFSHDEWDTAGVFIEIPPESGTPFDTKELLLRALRRIHEQDWIPSKKMKLDGTVAPYSARNGGGYTLEAELGISPNGYAEPDYLGWEIKQFGVNNFKSLRPKSPVTLLTPEPTGGIYKDFGAGKFIEKFGYPDKSGKIDRFNFGGRYICDADFHKLTGLRLVLIGYDAPSGKISDMGGGIALISRQDEIAAIWNFSGLLQHWNRKHAQAAYIPSIFRTPPSEYSFGSKILLCERTDFALFLKAISVGRIFYDPGIKVEGASTAKPKIKRRSQFRVGHNNLTTIYHESCIADLT